MRIMPLAFGVALAVGSTAFARPDPSNVDPESSYCWGENIGWLNWFCAGSPPGSQGAVVRSRFLSGFVWGENTGWINLGDGAPADGMAYANSSGNDFGVNRNPATGALSGLAWGENIGWINFAGGALATPPRPAVADFRAGRLRGYAWGESIGWINLDDATRFVAIRVCPPDFNADGLLNSQDFFDFLAAFFGGLPSADFNADTLVNSQDFFDYLTAFFAGC